MLLSVLVPSLPLVVSTDAGYSNVILAVKPVAIGTDVRRCWCSCYCGVRGLATLAVIVVAAVVAVVVAVVAVVVAVVAVVVHVAAIADAMTVALCVRARVVFTLISPSRLPIDLGSRVLVDGATARFMQVTECAPSDACWAQIDRANTPRTSRRSQVPRCFLA